MGEGRIIKIDFTDFWPGFNKKDNYFYNILAKKYNVEISDKPEYLFCSCFGNKHFRYKDCVKILFVGENVVPDFNLYDYAMGFHYISFEDRYLRLPLYVLYEKERDLALKKHLFSDEYYLSKNKFCNYVISNPNGASERDYMTKLLEEYKEVGSGGKYKNNVGGPVKDKLAFEKEYRFTMAFENSATGGYTTEKLLEAFAGDTIPIYWGSPEIANEFNPKAFINCHDYETLEQVMERVKEIDGNDELYLQMIKSPIVTEASEAKICFEQQYTEEFLSHIFEQKKENAFRRNMVYIGKDYQEKLKDAKRVQDMLDVVKRPIHLMNKVKAQALSKYKK